jgi:hypothetical protein
MDMNNKRPKIDKSLSSKVQKYANDRYDGNFTTAVNALLEVALNGAHKDEKTTTTSSIIGTSYTRN